MAMTHVQTHSHEYFPGEFHTELETRVMHTSKANVVVDLKRTPTRDCLDELEGELDGINGVSRAQASSRSSRLVLVDYDPEVIDSQKILGAVVRRGYDARLIGM
jgi:copper chaperone CopZ